jgi:hypothetical protein
MVAPLKKVRSQRTPTWHAGFLAMLPVIHDYARGAFAHLDAETRQDLMQEVIANAPVAYVRLFQQGRVALAYPTVLARYGISQVREGRRVGNRLRVKEVLSTYAQQRKKFHLESLDRYEEEEGGWQEILVEDKNATPAVLAATRIDFPAWLDTLGRRNRKIAQFLALGNGTGEAARKFGISEGRISQLRRELAEAWRQFVGEMDQPEAAAIPA